MRPALARVIISDMGASRGPGNTVAVIETGKNLGISEYPNDSGELFFTIPLNHPAASLISPLQQHYLVNRWAPWLGAYEDVGFGLIDDYEITKDEMIVYGTNWTGLLDTTITSAGTSYTSLSLGSIVQDNLSQVIFGDNNSRLAFTNLGTINNTSKTATLLTSFQSRLEFIRSVANLSMSDRSVRTNLWIDSTGTWQFIENQGQEDLWASYGVLLQYGQNVTSFRYWTGRSDFATNIAGIGIKRDGAAVLYSYQSYAPSATYGLIQRPSLHRDVINQAALDDMVKHDARVAGNKAAELALALVPDKTGWSGDGRYAAPGSDGIQVFDSLRVVINRGLLHVNDLYTCWGWEWTLDPMGRESYNLSLSPKIT